MANEPLMGWQLGKALREAGVIANDEAVTRVVIDCPAGGAVKIYEERVGDQSLLKVIPALTGVEIERG